MIERTYETSQIQCTPLETHISYAKMDGDRVILHASTQVPWHLRRIVATAWGSARTKSESSKNVWAADTVRNRISCLKM